VDISKKQIVQLVITEEIKILEATIHKSPAYAQLWDELGKSRAKSGSRIKAVKILEGIENLITKKWLPSSDVPESIKLYSDSSDKSAMSISFSNRRYFSRRLKFGELSQTCG